MKFILFSWLALGGMAQNLPPVSATSDYARLHPGLDTPKLLHSVDPEYTPQALAAGIEGSVVLEAVISPEGRVTNATVLSPLPAGLDRKALAAVKRWRYSPAVMDGELVPVLMTVDVLFRLPYRPDEKALVERRKTIQAMARKPNPAPSDVAAVRILAEAGMPAALGLLGEWKLKGSGMRKDVPGGMEDLRRAAAGNDARSLYLLGQAKLAQDDAQAWDLLRRAAFMGDAEAQRQVAKRAERAGDLNSARWYFRLCAARADAGCEYQLGRLIVSGNIGTPNDFTEGVTWLELAKEHGDAGAAQLWQSSVAKLSSIQLGWVAALKPHLELRGMKKF